MNPSTSEAPSETPADRIDPNDPAARDVWAKKLDVTPQQLEEAEQAVGDRAADVELQLKGARSTSNADRVADADAKVPGD